MLLFKILMALSNKSTYCIVKKTLEEWSPYNFSKVFVSM
jgi:hypothetical protein